MTANSVAEGGYSYRMVSDWGDIPDDWSIGDVAAVAVDGADRVYVFSRGTHPMVVLDRDGRILRTWGEGVFARPYGLHIGPDDALYCTDDGDHTVRGCTQEGRVELTLGLAGFPLACSRCGAQMRIIAFITDPSTLHDLLCHLGEPAAPPRIAPARGPPLWDLSDARTGDCVPHAQPAPAYEFDQRVAW